MSTIISSSSAEELVVKAPSAIPSEIQARAQKIMADVEKTLLDAAQRKAAQPKKEVAELVVPGGTLEWEVGMIGPIQLAPFANPPYDLNRVVQAGQPVLFLAVSFANPFTALYLAGKTSNYRFDFMNISNVTPGPSGIQAQVFSPTTVAPAPGVFSVSPIHLYGAIVTFPTPLPGPNGILASGSELYEANFSIDITTAGVPGAGFADQTFTFDSTYSLVVPGETPGWKQMPYRFLVNAF